MPLKTDILSQTDLQIFEQTPEGIYIWKNKNILLTFENLLENTFLLSTDLATYFNMQHKNVLRNIRKLQQEDHLPNHLLKVEQAIKIGNLAQRKQIIYALTRHQTECLIMDFAGPKARCKKFIILKRLQAIEKDVLKGKYLEARKKAQNWDGIQLLKDYGFKCSIDKKFATKQDIYTFLNIPASTLSSFLRRYSAQIQPIKLRHQELRKMGCKANLLNVYKLEDVFKIVLWLDNEIGIELKKRLFGEFGVYLTPKNPVEKEWEMMLAKAFHNFDFYHNYAVKNYRIDFVITKLKVALELDENNHRGYDIKKEKIREKEILNQYGLIRFNGKTD